jgi:Taurine catabolism dioxygenase TauD, TfdA family
MIAGAFCETEADTHVALRDRLLAPDAVLAAPTVSAISTAASPANVVQERLAEAVERDGIGLVAFDHPLEDAAFIEFFAPFGAPMPERDPAVIPFVRREVVLNVVAVQGHVANAALQPFGANDLTLHSEGSGRSEAEQPRYIVLMCCDPGDAISQARTILVPMADVAARLDPPQRSLLARTRYERNASGPMILREVMGRPVFAFRDFKGDPLAWVVPHGIAPADDDPGVVNAALRGLLAAMYCGAAFGLHWTPGLLIVIDNRRFFHGRTAAIGSSPCRRHLKRLRLV